MGDTWNLIKIDMEEIRDGELTIKTISAHELQIKDHTETEIKEIHKESSLPYSIFPFCRLDFTLSGVQFVLFFPQSERKFYNSPRPRLFIL